MKNYLQAYINHVQDDWVGHLPMTKFAANNYINILTEMSPFFADNKFYLYIDVKPSWIYEKTNQKAKLLKADQIVTNQKIIAKFLQSQLMWTQQKQIYRPININNST